MEQAGLVAAFPQGAGAPMAGIELTDIAASQFLHQARDGACFGRCGQQVDVIVHQRVAMQCAVCVEQCFAQQVQVAMPVGVIQEAGQAVVASLDDVLRDTRQVESRECTGLMLS
ncbi:hypothetical protein UUA_06249, partial [Rhodanobacter thiooxydans LCS2]